MTTEEPNEPGGEIVDRYVDFVFQPLKEDGRVWGIFIQGMDVSDRHRADQALALSKAPRPPISRVAVSAAVLRT